MRSALPGTGPRAARRGDTCPGRLAGGPTTRQPTAPGPTRCSPPPSNGPPPTGCTGTGSITRTTWRGSRQARTRRRRRRRRRARPSVRHRQDAVRTRRTRRTRDEEGAARDEDAETRRGGRGRSRTRDAWAEAGLRTGLRARMRGLRQSRSCGESEKHESVSRTVPADSSSQADGGWLADGDRRLTPEQNTDASKACEDIRTEGREVILPAMQRVEAADPDRRLAGLEHMLKGEDRLKEKIADELSAKPGAHGAARPGYSRPMPCDSRSLTLRNATLKEFCRRRSAEVRGIRTVKLKNLWTEEQYKGINSQWRRPETGLRFEVQFHTPESLEAKELTHKAYERIRSPASPEERSRNEGVSASGERAARHSPGTAEIKDFPEKRWTEKITYYAIDR